MLELNLGRMKLTFGDRPTRTQESGAALSSKGVQRYYNPDDLVGKKGLEVYQSMKRDAQVKACLAIKKASVLGRGWEVLPVVADGERGKEVAAFCTWSLTEMKGSVLRLLSGVCDALSMGYSIHQMLWRVVPSGRWAGKWCIQSAKGKDPLLWAFDVDEYLNIVGLRHNQTDKVYAPSRFVVYSHTPEYENPYGISELRACYRNWWSKDLLTRFWNLYLEKYGSPTVRGTFRRGTPKSVQDEFLKVLSAIQQQSAIVIPEDMKAELIETIRQGDVGYRIAVEFHNREIAKSILNMTLITDDGGQGIGSFALAKVHLDVLRMCLKSLKEDLEETVMEEQVLKLLVRYNFGQDVPVPKFTLGPMEDRELLPLSSGIKNLVDCGVLDPKDQFIREFLGLQGAGPSPGRPEVSTVNRTRQGTGPTDGNDGDVRVGT